jgi:tetratricopeptide (TPR) repeat protein
VDKRCLKLGSLYLAGGKFEKARGAFQRALDDKLDIRRSYVEMLQHSLESLADDSTHVAAINRQLAQPPSDEEMARYDLDVIRQVQQHDREVAVTHNYLGWVDIQTDKLDQAAAHFEKSLQIWPGNRNASENLTIIREIQSGATPPGR